MAMTKQFPVKVLGDTVTAANWNGIESYRLIEGEENDYNAGTTQMSYSYIADTATVGVLIMATSYFEMGASHEGSESHTTEVKVDTVVKQTIRSYMNTNYGSSVNEHVYSGSNYPIIALLTAADMTLDANHTITVDAEATAERLTASKVTSMIVHLL